MLCGVVFVLNNLCLQRIGGEIKSFSTDSWVARKLSKRMDKYMLYLLTVGKKALADGGITHDKMDELNKEKCGILIGSVGRTLLNFRYSFMVNLLIVILSEDF